MIRENQYQDLIGRTAYDRDGNKIGKLGQVFLDDETGRAEWVTVHTGFFGMNESFAPISQVELRGDDEVTIPLAKDAIKDAPNVDVNDGHLTQDDERRLYEHYGLTYSPWSGQVGTTQQMQASNLRLRPYSMTGNRPTRQNLPGQGTTAAGNFPSEQSSHARVDDPSRSDR